MKRAMPLLLLALLGCDAAAEPLGRAGKAEAEGNLDEAGKLYAEVCAKATGSPLCAVARKKLDRLAIKLGYKALDEGQYGKAQQLFGDAAKVEDPAVKRAAAAGLAEPALTAGLLWEEASALPDKAAAQLKMAALADGHAAVAPKAREWLGKNGAGVLLAAVKAACKPDGAGSCVDLGQRMATLHAGTPEAAEAAAAVEEETRRLVPVLKLAENLLIQRLEVYRKKAKYELCQQHLAGEPDPAGACQASLNLSPTEAGFSTGPIEVAFGKKLSEISDTGRVNALHVRYRQIEEKGEYDPASWPKATKK